MDLDEVWLLWALVLALAGDLMKKESIPPTFSARGYQGESEFDSVILIAIQERNQSPRTTINDLCSLPTFPTSGSTA